MKQAGWAGPGREVDCRTEMLALNSLNIWCFQIKMHLQPDVVLRPGICPTGAKATSPVCSLGTTLSPPWGFSGILTLPWSVLSRLKAVTEKGCYNGACLALETTCPVTVHLPGLPRTPSQGKASPGEEPRRLGPPPSCKWLYAPGRALTCGETSPAPGLPSWFAGALVPLQASSHLLIYPTFLLSSLPHGWQSR